jgi:Zn-finger nucleic acid-binding protein
MKCPKCRSANLATGQLEKRLPSVECEHCGGSLLSLTAYRNWRAFYPQEASDAGSAGICPDLDETSRVLSCPKCAHIMLKFRVASDAENRIDVCTHCEEVWLDPGEWATLKSGNLHGALPAIFTEPWQRRLRNERSRRVREQQWRQRLGEEIFLEARKTRAWLAGTPDRDAVLDFLRRDDPYEA